jgi:outer membrane protein assembly factor BamD
MKTFGQVGFFNMKFLLIILSVFVLTGCGVVRSIFPKGGSKKSVAKILKSKDPVYKLGMAEQFYVKKKYNKAQVIFEDVMPYYRPLLREFEDIYYKYTYCAYYQGDYLNAQNLFKTYLEIFPTSTRAEEASYMRAYCYYKLSPKPELDQTTTIRAMNLMQIFINTHPGSQRIKEANEIIDICRRKLEVKDYQSALLYYNMGQFRAAGVAFTTLLNSYPDSEKGDEYMLLIIKSYYRYAEMSIEEKKKERFEQVISEYNTFTDRFPDSKLKKEAEEYYNLSQNNIKNLSNEQVKTST